MPALTPWPLFPPPDWDQFESLCADLFARIWNVTNVVRNGRQGQGQKGVDIHGRLPDGRIIGVQCKHKQLWPPIPLTIREIDKEIAKARSFHPKLSEYIIATTAQGDAKIIEHVARITQNNLSQGLFTVDVLGWSELLRRLKDYDDLIEHHYPYTSLKKIGNDINDLPEKIVKVLVEYFRSLFSSEERTNDDFSSAPEENDQTQVSDNDPNSASFESRRIDVPIDLPRGRVVRLPVVILPLIHRNSKERISVSGLMISPLTRRQYRLIDFRKSSDADDVVLQLPFAEAVQLCEHFSTRAPGEFRLPEFEMWSAAIQADRMVQPFVQSSRSQKVVDRFYRANEWQIKVPPLGTSEWLLDGSQARLVMEGAKFVPTKTNAKSDQKAAVRLVWLPPE